jgi:glycosyltransferase involved in cell wall biosynthesis
VNHKDSFVTGFLGRRDGYQVPIALAEAGKLCRFVTGAYDSGFLKRVVPILPKSFRSAIRRRNCEQIPEELIDSRPMIEFGQNVSRMVGDKRNHSWLWANRAMSFAVCDLARKFQSDLLLYEPYAAEAFSAKYSHLPRKVLFHFHLHPVFERRLLDEDIKAYPPGPSSQSWLRMDAKPENDGRIVNLWRQADLVLAASTFTKRSLVEQGMPPERCVVVPYGINQCDTPEIDNVCPHFSVLFVGSGIQRKGLHHLLMAWKEARLPAQSTLTLVCRNMDPAVATLLASMPSSVTVLNGVSFDVLKRLFQQSSLFAMPSILEGFGQVFLEALSFGCPVLGTPNTCLPDLGDETNGVFLTPVCDHRSLVCRLEELSRVLTQPSASEIRRRASVVAEQFSLRKFRSRLIAALNDLNRDQS